MLALAVPRGYADDGFDSVLIVRGVAMRCVLFCAFALLVPSAAWAERINVTATSATYWTQTGRLDLEAWFDRPIDLTTDEFRIGGTDTLPPYRQLFLIHNRYVVDEYGVVIRNTYDPILDAYHVAYDFSEPRNTTYVTTDLGTFGFTLSHEGRHIRVSLPFSETRMPSPAFACGAAAWGPGSVQTAVACMSSIDERVVYTPEPHSVALASLGVVALIAHRWRRLRSRYGTSDSLQ